ncbi:MAG: hypothetical protein ACK4F0_01505 [Candidatus Ratteibacteria bacterium]
MKDNTPRPFPFEFSASSIPSLSIKGKEPSDNCKDITLSLTTSVGGQDKANLTVFSVDVNLGGMNEATEEETGLYLPLNDDDDNSDTILDYNQHPVFGENDLVSVSISCVPSDLPGNLTLSWGSNVKLWNNMNKETEIKTTTYQANQLPKTFYVEGYKTSNSIKDTEIKLTYQAPDETTAEDKAKVTVIAIESVYICSRSGNDIPSDETRQIVVASSNKNPSRDLFTVVRAKIGTSNYYLGEIGTNLPTYVIIGGNTINVRRWNSSLYGQLSILVEEVFPEIIDDDNDKVGYRKTTFLGSGWHVSTQLSEGTHKYLSTVTLIGLPGRKSPIGVNLHCVNRQITDYPGNPYIQTATGYINVPYILGIHPDEYGENIGKSLFDGYNGIDCSGLAYY